MAGRWLGETSELCVLLLHYKTDSYTVNII